MLHRSVLLQEVIKGLDIQPGDVVVDGTLGNGGHSKAIADIFGTSIKQIGIDLDQDALDRSKERLADTTCDMTYVLGSFRNIDEHMKALGQEVVNKVLLDIGLSSNQLEESGRGFAFRSDEPLKMTFKNSGMLRLQVWVKECLLQSHNSNKASNSKCRTTKTSSSKECKIAIL
jgi:16S rRNA (cytosine1402-N4)-methyltransferase